MHPCNNPHCQPSATLLKSLGMVLSSCAIVIVLIQITMILSNWVAYISAGVTLIFTLSFIGTGIVGFVRRQHTMRCRWRYWGHYSLRFPFKVLAYVGNAAVL